MQRGRKTDNNRHPKVVCMTKHFNGNQAFILEPHQGRHHCPHIATSVLPESKAGFSLIGWVRLLMRWRSWIRSALRACERLSVCCHFAHHKRAKCESWTVPAQDQLYCREIIKTHTLPTATFKNNGHTWIESLPLKSTSENNCTRKGIPYQIHFLLLNL